MSNHVVLRLDVAKKVALAVAATAAMAAPFVSAQAQQATETPKFEVAYVKLCKDAGVAGLKGGGGGGIRWVPGRLDEECQRVADLIRDAYLAYPEGKPFAAGTPADPSASRCPPGQGCTGCGYGLPPVSDRLMWQPIQGSPAWLTSERYTIVAKADGPATPEMMRGPMMRALLEDRFKLKIHRESKEVPVYELIVAKGEPKLQPFQEGSCISRDKLSPPAPGNPVPRRICGGFHSGEGGTDIVGTTISNFCRQLSSISDLEVIDKTGLTGMFDIHLDTRPVGPADDAPGRSSQATGILTEREPGELRPSLQLARFTEFQNALPKLGLKLERAKSSRMFLVVDYVERPSGN